MPSVLALFGEIDLKSGTFKSKLKRAENDFQTTMRKMQDGTVKTEKASQNLFNRFSSGSSVITRFSSAMTGAGAAAAAAGLAIEHFLNVGQMLGNAAYAAIKLGAAYESVENSIKVFSGSTAKATQELTALNQMALNSVGLRLETAQKGYQQLRSLGFAAETARGFLKELSEEKLFSGASEEALQKIVFNFGQIASGGQKVSQELREMFTQMPSLRKAFYETFGSLDPNKIQTFFDEDANGAIEKFIKTLEKGKTPIAGLNDAWGKFLDSWIVGAQEFSKPILPGLTRDLQTLTKIVLDNKDAFTRTGRNVSAFLQEIRDNFHAVKQAAQPVLDIFNGFDKASQFFKELQSKPFGDGLKMPENTFKDAIDRMTKGTAIETDFGMKDAFKSFQSAFDANITKTSESADEWKQIMSDMVWTMEQDSAASLKRSLEQFKVYYSERFNITANSLKLQQAVIGAFNRDTVQDEIKGLNQLQDVRKKSYQTQLADLSKYYNFQIDAAKGDKQAVAELTAERNNKIRDLNADFRISEINNQKQIAELEKKILETRRNALINFKNLSIRESRTMLDAIKTNFDKFGDIGNYSANLNRLRDAVASTYGDITKTVLESYALQLNDTRLTLEQRTNLYKEQALEISDIARQQSEQFAEIEAAGLKRSENNFRAYTDRITDFLKSRADIFKNLQSSVFQNSLSFGDGLDVFSKFAEQSDLAKSAVQKLSQVLSGQTSIYQAQKDFLDKAQQAEIAGLQSQIDLNKNLIDLEKVRLTGAKRSEIVDLQTKITQAMEQQARAQKAAAGAADDVSRSAAEMIRDNYKAIIGNLGFQLKDAKAELASLETTAADKLITPAINTLKTTIAGLQQAQENLGLSQAIEQQNLFAQSTEGLKAAYEAIASGSKQRIVDGLAENELWKERLNVISSLSIAQAKLADFSGLNALGAEIAQLQIVNGLYDAQLQKIIEINTTLGDKIRLATAQTESFTTFWENTALNSMNRVSDVFASALTKQNQTLQGFFADVAKGFSQMAAQMAADLLRLTIYKSLLKLFSGLASSGLGSLGSHGGADVGGGDFGGHSIGTPDGFGGRGASLLGASLRSSAIASAVNTNNTNNSNNRTYNLSFPISERGGNQTNARTRRQLANEVVAELKKIEYQGL